MAGRDPGNVWCSPRAGSGPSGDDGTSSAALRNPHLALEVEALATRAEGLVQGQPPQIREWATDRGRLQRFLAGHGCNEERALATLRWCLEQRQQLRLWHIDLEEVRAELELGKVVCRGLDRDSHPVVLYRNCRADHTLDLTMRLRALVLVLDYLEVCLDRGDFDGNTTWVVVLDLGGKPAKGSMSYDYLSRLIKLFMKSYPARLHKCFVVDANMLMNAFWGAARKILEADTIRKVSFVRRTWDKQGKCKVPELLAHVGEERLESDFGGADHFAWDPARHWRTLDLVPKVRREPPLVEAARLAVRASIASSRGGGDRRLSASSAAGDAAEAARLAALEAGMASSRRGSVASSSRGSCAGFAEADAEGARRARPAELETVEEASAASNARGGRSSPRPGHHSDEVSCGGESVGSGGRSLDSAEDRWFDAASETPAPSPVETFVRDCRSLQRQLGPGLPVNDPRLLRLRADLARFLQDWEAGIGAAAGEEDSHHCGHSYHCGDHHEKDPLQPHHISLQDSPSAMSTFAPSAAATPAGVVAALASSDVRMKALLTISGTTLLFVVLLFGLVIVKLSEDIR